MNNLIESNYYFYDLKSAINLEIPISLLMIDLNSFVNVMGFML